MQISLNKNIELNEIIHIIKEKLEAGGKVMFTPNGKSMLPMLRDGEDVVVLEKPKGRLQLFDVALYVRSNGQYVLHRVVSFKSDGTYVMCGDNQYTYEYGIGDDDVVAVMSGFFRKGKAYTKFSLPYRLYINVWYYTRIFRRLCSFGKRKISHIYKKGK